METLERIIAQHPFVKDLESEYVKLIVGCASNVRFNASQFVFREGEEANEFYMIRQGKVALQISAPQGGSLRFRPSEKAIYWGGPG